MTSQAFADRSDGVTLCQSYWGAFLTWHVSRSLFKIRSITTALSGQVEALPIIIAMKKSLFFCLQYFLFKMTTSTVQYLL